MRSSDQMLARYVGEIEERQRFIDGMTPRDVDAMTDEEYAALQRYAVRELRARDRAAKAARRRRG